MQRPLLFNRRLTLEVVVTLVAVVHLSSAGEPALELPDIALTLLLLNEGHPPVDADENGQTDHPLDGDPQQVDPTEQNKPQATLLAFNTGQLHMGAAALGTSLIVCHNIFLLFLSSYCVKTTPIGALNLALRKSKCAAFRHSDLQTKTIIRFCV